MNNITESSLGRIYQHIIRENVNSWAILTSYRSENAPSKNKQDFIDDPLSPKFC